MSTPKRQHWVPRMYLAGFATPESKASTSQLWVLPREEGEPFLSSVENLAVQRHLYSPVGADGERSFRLEWKFGELEFLMAELWPHLARGAVDLTRPRVRQGVALFIATLYLRNPQRLSQQKEVIRRLHDQLVAIPREDRELYVVQAGETILPLRPGGWDDESPMSDADHHRMFGSLIERGAVPLAKHLLGRRWTAVIAEEDAFTTSDAPVVLSHPTKTNYGFATDGVMVTLPVSPTCVLQISDEGGSQGYYQSKPGFPEAMNWQTWDHAERYLLSSMRPGSVVASISRFLDEVEAQKSRAKPTSKRSGAARRL